MVYLYGWMFGLILAYVGIQAYEYVNHVNECDGMYYQKQCWPDKLED